MREINNLIDIEKVLTPVVSKSQRVEILSAVDSIAKDKAKNSLLPQRYASVVLWIFAGLNFVIISLIIAAFLADIRVIGDAQGTDRFITQGVLISLITGVIIEVSFCVKEVTKYFFNASNKVE
jgi:hypothetical protein